MHESIKTSVEPRTVNPKRIRVSPRPPIMGL